jgi:hypothetical protein
MGTVEYSMGTAVGSGRWVQQESSDPKYASTGLPPDCSKMALTCKPTSKVWVAPPGRELVPPVAGSKQIVHWTSGTC